MKKLLSSLAFAATTLIASASMLLAEEKGLDDATRAPYYDAIKGKKVVFVPLAMGFDLTEGWAAAMRKQANEFGYTFDIRDPNWSTDAGTRAITAAIQEKPDVLVVQNPDIQSYARLLKRAEEAGIKTIQINMNSVYTTDAFIGVDQVKLGEVQAQALVDHCGAGKGPSTKVALLQGVPNGAANLYMMRGIYSVLSQHPEIQVVSEQAANYDPSKARAIMETVLQQHPDICGVWGVWDSQDVGTAAAIAEAKKTGKVFLVTSGGGNEAACENVKKGLFDLYVTYDTSVQGMELNQKIAEFLQTQTAAGAVKTTYFTPLRMITKSNVNVRNCWSLTDMQ
ncbi:sugar ABC transporter substrate-binding protein [Mesorhizobium argentiipisi]|uniref:Sugar ABC transporter substrate-binding protein n=1 Tax=Mesorhizobium argentiipisi TaxID=3015175 RepID=A0ABU8KA80_9HYPH